MSKLEPTRTSSDLTATERLRELLDERGVEWRETALGETRWLSTVLNGNVSAKRINDKLVLFTGYKLITPEQAIAATLGREPDDAAMVKLHDQMNAALFEYERAQGIEKRDGDEAIVVPWVVKMHALLEEAATLGSRNCSNNCTNSERTNGTCHADETDTWECVFDQIGHYGKRVTVHVMECSECGRTYEQVNGGYEFCPHCGRRAVEVDE